MLLAEGREQDEQGGRRRDALDKLIAAPAQALDVTLVTNHSRDYVSYLGPRVENWVD